MIRQKMSIISFVILATAIAGCASATTSPGVETSNPATSSISDASTSTEMPTPTAIPTVSPTATPTSIPDPGSLNCQIVPLWTKISFEQPLYFTVSGDNNSDAFVVERTGRIWIVPADNKNEPQIFLDLSSSVDLGGQEKGLLGLAFHPEYAQNGYFYVNFTDRQGTVIARYNRKAAEPKAADPDSGVILLTFDQPYTNHNGGHLAFGPDGYLYIATGDGGSKGDPQNNAQNLSNFLGKILRIDVDHPVGDLAYGIPPDNPWAGNNVNQRQEIFAYGLRNPWRFSFDSRGWLWVADVGQNRIEEIDLVTAGGNYGWSAKEGSSNYRTLDGVDLNSLIPPVYEYDHTLGESITGGYVYSGQQIPQLQNTYVYGDFISGRIWAIWFDAEGQPHNTQLLDTDLKISSFGIDHAGEIIVVDFRGTIYQLR